MVMLPLRWFGMHWLVLKTVQNHMTWCGHWNAGQILREHIVPSLSIPITFSCLQGDGINAIVDLLPQCIFPQVIHSLPIM